MLCIVALRLNGIAIVSPVLERKIFSIFSLSERGISKWLGGALLLGTQFPPLEKTRDQSHI